MSDSLRDLAHRLGGEVSGGGVLCPGPGHSRLDRSLRVFFDRDAPDGFTVVSFCNDPWNLCRDHVRDLLGMETWRPGASTLPPPPTSRRAKPARCDDDHNRRLALNIFSEAKAITGTIAEVYLVKRIGRALEEWPADVRFHPACARNLEGNVERRPAVIVLLRDVCSDEPKAIQRIFLNLDGADRVRDSMGKATLGPARGAVLKLSPCATVTHGLGIAEGAETGLAIFSKGWRPIWACCGSATMAKFPVLAGIESLSVFADNDAAGQRAAHECAQRWRDAGAEARVRTPKTQSQDWCDVVRAA